jgi:hypothetical protein
VSRPFEREVVRNVYVLRRHVEQNLLGSVEPGEGKVNMTNVLRGL